MYENLIDEYLSALTVDIREKGGRTDRLFDTVYDGGGTPPFWKEGSTNFYAP